MINVNRVSRILTIVTLAAASALAQNVPNAGEWKTWVIASGSDHAVPAPPDAAATRAELDWLRAASAIQSQALSTVLAASRKTDAAWHAAALKRG